MSGNVALSLVVAYSGKTPRTRRPHRPEPPDSTEKTGAGEAAGAAPVHHAARNDRPPLPDQRAGVPPGGQDRLLVAGQPSRTGPATLAAPRKAAWPIPHRDAPKTPAAKKPLPGQFDKGSRPSGETLPCPIQSRIRFPVVFASGSCGPSEPESVSSRMARALSRLSAADA